MKTKRKEVDYYEATIKWINEDPEEMDEEHVLIKVGGFDEETATNEEKNLDENIFFYIDHAEEIKHLTKEGVEDFIVTHYTPVYK